MLWIVGFLGLYVLGLFAVVWISLHPYRIPGWIGPGSMGAPQEDIEFESDGNTLRGWWIESPESTSVVIFAHGYMMNKCELTPEAVQMWRRGASCLVFDHRAHGKSGGKKCGLGLRERVDIANAVREAKRRKPGTKIGLVGSSMGSAAIALAMGDDPSLADAIVLDSCFSSLVSASLGWWRFVGGNALMVLLSPTTLISGPMAGFNPFRVDVAKSLEKLRSTPVLFLHGSKDNLALPSHAQRNIDAHSGPHTVVWFEGCGHSEGRWEQPEKYQEALVTFFQEQGILAAGHHVHGNRR